jgi:hypothetical protein
MIERQIDSPMPTPSGLVVTKVSNSRLWLSVDADAGVLHRDQHLVGFAGARAEQQGARPLGHRRHSLDAGQSLQIELERGFEIARVGEALAGAADRVG